jgi:hypothetical protein
MPEPTTTGTDTQTQTATDTQTQTATDTQTQTATDTQTQTSTGADTQTQTATDTQTDTDLSKVTLQDGKGSEAQTQTQTTEVNEEDYATKITLDETIAKDVEVDAGAMKAVAPILKEAGVSVETAGKLVNALARYQVEQFKARNAERYADNKRMHDAAIQKYSKVDFEQINAGIDAAFARDGVMNYVIRNSEIGNDPEFLALMLWYGQHKPTNTQPAGGGGGGGTTGQAAGFNGIAKAWD